MDCKRAQNDGNFSRDPLIRVLDRIDRDDEIMGWIDSIVITALDLQKFPDNVDDYGVVMLVRAQPIIYSNGDVNTTSKVFHIVKAIRLENSQLPSDFGGIQERSRQSKAMMLLRACWEFEHLPQVVCDYTRCIGRSVASARAASLAVNGVSTERQVMEQIR